MEINSETVAVVTGGANGIGLALGEALIGRGARVALADINGERAKSVAAALGERARGYACDVTDPASLAALADAVVGDFGGVDLLFVNAGIALGGTVIDIAPQEIQWLYDVNVIGAVSTVRAFYPALEARSEEKGAARIVFTGSENSVGLPALGPASVYTSTKHAILGIADALRRDLQETKVTVAIFCPGLTATRLWDARALRHDRYGGPVKMPEEEGVAMDAYLKAAGQDPALTARICLDGVAQDEFIIITDPVIRTFAERRHGEVGEALDRLDTRLADYGIASADGN